MKTVVTCAWLFLTAFSGFALSWDYHGHEVTGSIADQLLTPAAKAQVEALLEFELKVAGPWLDCVRSVALQPDGSFKYAPDPNHPEYRIPCTSFEGVDETKRMEDYVTRNWKNCNFSPHKPNHCHEAFHFADVAIQHNHYDRNYAGTSDHDIVGTINAAIAVLKGQAWKLFRG